MTTKKIKISVTRDSVCAGDDYNAPHQKTVLFDAASNPQQLITSILDQRYLVYIDGGKATWVASLDGKPIGVVAQQWSEPKLVQSLPGGLTSAKNLHFSYRAQSDPDSVFATI